MTERTIKEESRKNCQGENRKQGGHEKLLKERT
jgi:hypothetical protein